MRNTIIFTQDVPGERQWIGEHFPGYINLETQSSGKWSEAWPVPGDQCSLYEIAQNDHFDQRTLMNLRMDKIKIHCCDDARLTIEDNKHWTITDRFISKKNYSVFRDQPKTWVLNIARSGTVFVETLLAQFRTRHQNHVGVGSDDALLQIYDQARYLRDVALVLVYRNDLWQTFISTVLGIRYGFHHENHFDWNLVEPVLIGIDDMLQFESSVLCTLNFWCNLRCLLPSHSFLLLDGKQMIDLYQDQVNHKAVNYNKKNLISNYDWAQKIWQEQFGWYLDRSLNNAVKHLNQMQCRNSIDHLT